MHLCNQFEELKKKDLYQVNKITLDRYMMKIVKATGEQESVLQMLERDNNETLQTARIESEKSSLQV